MTKYRDAATASPVLMKEPKVEFVDDGPGKPVGINHFIGRRPIFAFGNSDGDQQMLEWTAAGERPALHGPRPPHRRRARIRLRPQVAHRQARQGARRGDQAKGWTVVDMKHDWKTIFLRVRRSCATGGTLDR